MIHKLSDLKEIGCRVCGAVVICAVPTLISALSPQCWDVGLRRFKLNHVNSSTSQTMFIWLRFPLIQWNVELVWVKRPVPLFTCVYLRLRMQGFVSKKVFFKLDTAVICGCGSGCFMTSDMCTCFVLLYQNPWSLISRYIGYHMKGP